MLASARDLSFGGAAGAMTIRMALLAGAVMVNRGCATSTMPAACNALSCTRVPTAGGMESVWHLLKTHTQRGIGNTANLADGAETVGRAATLAVHWELRPPALQIYARHRAHTARG